MNKEILNKKIQNYKLLFCLIFSGKSFLPYIPTEITIIIYNLVNKPKIIEISPTIEDYDNFRSICSNNIRQKIREMSNSLTVTERIRKSEDIFDILAKNTYFMTLYKNFRIIIVSKLIEFAKCKRWGVQKSQKYYKLIFNREWDYNTNRMIQIQKLDNRRCTFTKDRNDNCCNYILQDYSFGLCYPHLTSKFKNF